MTKLLKLLPMCIALFTLTSCIQVDTAVKVKQDGSGVIEETFLMKKDFLQQMKKMVEGMAKSMNQTPDEKDGAAKTQQGVVSENKAEGFDLFDEAKLRLRAKDMGEGVTYLKGSKVVTDDYEGYRAVYAFTDINKVKINQNEGEKIPSGPTQSGPAAERAKEYITFSFTKGRPAELLIKIPEKKTNKTPENASGDVKSSPKNTEEQKAMAEQMKKIFQGMKIALSVTVDGKILETNAAYRDGSKITLMEVDFGKLMEMPEQLEKFSQSKPKTAEEFKALLQDMPGIKVDLNREIRIKFEKERI